MKIKVLVLCFFCINLLVGCQFNMFQNSKGHEDEEKEQSMIDIFNEKIEVNRKEESLFDFKPAKVKGEDSMIGIPVGIANIPLHLGEDYYYEIQMPDSLKILTDNSKHIFAEDGSVSVSVISNTDIESFLSLNLIENPESIRSNLIVSKADEKGPQEAAIQVVNDKIIMVRTYDNPTAYHIILEGLLNNTHKKVQLIEPILTDGLIEEKKLPAYQGYHITVNSNLGDKQQKIYAYDDGYLIISEELRKFNEAKLNLVTKASIVTGHEFLGKLYQEGEKIFYAELGNITIGIQYINYNTVITCYGIGEEARYNTLEFLRDYQ